MRAPALLLAAGGLVLPSLAAAADFTPLLDGRLRFEGVEQDGIAKKAEAATARVRAGFQLGEGDFRFLAESEATLALDEQYNSGINGKLLYPVVADPENVELNRLQLEYDGLPATRVTLGRQRINLDNQRFVGSVGWRDNEQTFDAVRVEWSGVKSLKADITYAWSDRTIWGVDGFGTRQQAVRGDNIFANLSWKHAFGTLTGFAYLVDQDEAPVLANSSQTYGVRFAGGLPVSKLGKINYALSYANQKDFNRNPNSYSANYWLGEIGLEAKGVKLGAGYEVLAPGFQTPLATLHRFNGWADKFLSTPPNGLRDLYVTGGYGWKGFSLSGAWHRFRSDRLGLHYGTEIDLQATARLGKRLTALAKFADYDADGFATDTRKYMFQLEYSL